MGFFMEFINKNTETLSYQYIGLMFLITIMFILFSKLSKKDISNFAITSGVLGTFLGIYAGLYSFNTNNIEGSVPGLLEGLKLAFLTSIAGMIIGIVVKNIPIPDIVRFRKKDNSQDQSVGKQIVINLNKLIDLQKESSVNEFKQLLKIEKAITGDGDATLSTQISKLRTDFRDKQDELIKEFKEFSHNMSENNSKALIDALTEVMKDFNTKINEQFGDNFKKLNEAVGLMLDWQKEYKSQINETINLFEKSLNGIENAEKSIEIIKNNVSIFESTANGMQSMLFKIDDKMENLENGLNQFSGIADNAKNAFPKIEKNINLLTDGFTKIINDTIKMGESQLKTLSNQSVIINASQKIMSDGIAKTTNSLNNQMKQFFEDNAERLTIQIKALDESLENELKKSLSSFAGQLAALSKQFVDDYSPLTEKLEKVVKISEKIEMNNV